MIPRWPVILVLSALAVAAGCQQVAVGLAGGTGLPPRADALRMDVAATKSLLDLSLDWRAREIRHLEEMKPRLGSGVLGSADLAQLYRGAEDYVFLHRRWQALIDSQGPEAWTRKASTLVNDPLARLQAKLVLAAALIQFDDYAIGVEPAFKQDKLRRLLKRDHPPTAGEIDAAVLRFLDPVKRLRLANAVVWYQSEGAKLREEDSADEALLDEVIRQSAGYTFFTADLATRTSAGWKTGGHAGVAYVADLFDDLGRAMTHSTSKTIGNTVGLVESRRGYLHDLPLPERDDLRRRLRPLDVLLEKTPFRLTDKSIPGHYGHVAVWVGNEAELRALGVWNDPLVRPHQARIRAGAAIVEALRSGVEINTLDHFLNIDDLLVIRPAPQSDEAIRAGVLRAFAQVGKEYDFNFDVETDRRIVCSELAYVVFPGIQWPTSKVLGRKAISPDQVAQRATRGGPFSPLVLFHDGVEIRKQLTASLECLLQGEEANFRALHPEFEGKTKPFSNSLKRL